MGNRFGIVALTVAALIAAGPASAQLSAKPAVGTVIGVKSAIYAPGSQPGGLGSLGYADGGGGVGDGLGGMGGFYALALAGAAVAVGVQYSYSHRDNPGSP